MLSCNSRVPVISSIDPKIGRMGEVITLKGNNFGTAKEESYVTIAGVSPTNSSYYGWYDDLIMVRVPESGESGLVYVHVKGKKSNGVLFSNSAAVPRPVEGEDFGLEPRIAVINPQTGTPGTLITITGSNFGGSRESSPSSALNNSLNGVFFSWDFETPANPFAVIEPEFIEVSEIELGYEAWSAREIRVRVPDGAVSGNLHLRTSHGESRPVFFDISGKPGYKNFRERRSYTISYSVDARILEASRPNSLYLWMPVPITSSSQRNVRLVSRTTNPFVENHRGVSLFKLDNLTAGSSHSVNLSYNVEVYAVETGIRPVYIRQGNTPLLALYTQNSNLIPAENPRIRTMVNTIVGREQNPYIKARMLYDWIINNIQIVEALSSPANNAADILERRESDPYHTALLFAAMARAARVPCVPVAGVLVNRNNRTLRHYWTEIWIDDFGWLPVDPVMGAGSVPSSYIFKQDLANYYFGNLDSQRIAFSRGEVHLSQMEARGRLVSHPQSYSLQNIWEEAAGGLESYTSLWGDITITGIYQ